MNATNTGLCKSLVLFVLILLIGTSTAFAGKKVLIEQQAGAWCGWCPGGTVVMDELIDQYPDQVIGVKWHNGDGMAIPEQSQFAQTFGINSYPSGTIDRQPYNGTMQIGWQQWKTAITPHFSEENIADLEVTYDYNTTTQIITAKVTAKILKDDNRQLALNLYIMEDYCVGSGSLWDQKNYFANNASYVGHPYYSKPSTIKNYNHMKVVRKVLGGLYGSTKNMLPSVKDGMDFSETFTFKKDPSWKANDLYVVGIIQVYKVSGSTLVDGTILNAQEAGKKPEIITEVSVSQPNILATPGATISKKVRVNNPQDFPITVTLAQGTLPAGWNVTFPGPVSIAAKSYVDVDASVTVPTGKASFVEVKFTATPDVIEGSKSVITNGSFNVLTDNTECINMVFDKDKPNMKYFNDAMIAMPQFKDNTVLIPYSLDILNSYPADLFKYIGISSPYSTRGILGSTSAESQTLRDYVKTAIAKGVKIFFSNELEMYNTFGIATSSPDAKTLFTSMGLGNIVAPIQLVQLNSQNQIIGFYKINVKGIATDPITDGLSFEINNKAGQDATKTIYFAENLNLNTQIATPILNYSDANGTLMGTAGARIELPTTRVVYLGYCFEATSDETKQTLANNIITWLFGGAVAEGPKISVDTKTVAFGTVDTDKSKDMEVTLTNTGDETLTVFSILKQGDNINAFTLTSGFDTKTILKGATAKIGIRFQPKSGADFSGTIAISTNAKNEPSLNISLTGKGNPAGSVAYGVTPNGALSMTMTPNPVVESSQFNYTINGETNRNVRIYVMDITGKVVSELVNSSMTAGEYNMNFSSEKFVSGTYYIVADVDGSQAQIPVVIAK